MDEGVAKLDVLTSGTRRRMSGETNRNVCWNQMRDRWRVSISEQRVLHAGWLFSFAGHSMTACGVRAAIVDPRPSDSGGNWTH
jgi:hypothetical protein